METVLLCVIAGVLILIAVQLFLLMSRADRILQRTDSSSTHPAAAPYVNVQVGIPGYDAGGLPQSAPPLPASKDTLPSITAPAQESGGIEAVPLSKGTGEGEDDELPAEPEPELNPLRPVITRIGQNGIAIITCPECKAENTTYRRTCFKCGAALS